MKILLFLWVPVFFCSAARAQKSPEDPSFSVKYGGAMLDSGKSAFTVIGFGGNYSLADSGKIYFFANDIWLGEILAGGKKGLEGVVDSSLIVYPSTSPYAMKEGVSYLFDENNWPLPLITADFKEYSGIRKFWVRSPVKIGNGYYVFYSIMNNYGRGLYDYFRVGQGVAYSEKISGPYKKAASGGRNSFWNDIEPAFGEAVLHDLDGWLYVYGKNPGNPYRKGASLARVRPADILKRERYSYYTEDYDKKKWTDDITEASVALEGADEEFSVSYNRHLKKYLAVYFDADSQTVFLKTSPYPWGKWSAPVRIKVCVKDEFCYGAKEQLPLSEAEGKKIFITLGKKHMPYLYEVEFR
ncbi:MAG: hypothetical protein COT17_05775 [Elusimicrobia bacterium CG08_land_8_20_14_0_20_51_18]|nr:MAG: hypothetical protein COT17_05775 [Elusimicrobia bacterium CG08_land_8_20_14_0_20_51_18]